MTRATIGIAAARIAVKRSPTSERVKCCSDATVVRHATEIPAGTEGLIAGTGEDDDPRSIRLGARKSLGEPSHDVGAE